MQDTVMMDFYWIYNWAQTFIVVHCTVVYEAQTPSTRSMLPSSLSCLRLYGVRCRLLLFLWANLLLPAIENILVGL